MILKELPSDIRLVTPFNVDSIGRDNHITFLDTKGRPTIIFKKKNLTEKHTGLIYVRLHFSLW